MAMQVDMVKIKSSRRRYEYWRAHGVDCGLYTLSGKDLDDYTDLKIYEEEFPGKPVIVTVAGADQSLADEEHDCDLSDK